MISCCLKQVVSIYLLSSKAEEDEMSYLLFVLYKNRLIRAAFHPSITHSLCHDSRAPLLFYNKHLP